MRHDASPEDCRRRAELGTRLADGLQTDDYSANGVAHGSAGRLLALLRWAEVTGSPLGRQVTEGLDALAGAAEVARGGQSTFLRYKPNAGHPLVASWCNGAAGLVHLWLAAHRVLGHGRWDRLAEQAGTTAESGQYATSGDLCCGLGGQAYALLALYRVSGDVRWLRSGRRLAEGAADIIVRVRPDVRDSLFAGEPGVATLTADLAYPADARMPLVDP